MTTDRLTQIAKQLGRMGRDAKPALKDLKRAPQRVFDRAVKEGRYPNTKRRGVPEDELSRAGSMIRAFRAGMGPIAYAIKDIRGD